MDREAVARIIEPQAWACLDRGKHLETGQRIANQSLAKADQIIALSGDQGWRAPDGWVLVPREPSEGMVKAATGALSAWRATLSRDEAVERSYRPNNERKFIASATPAEKHALRYRAMLSAAPPPPGQSEQGAETNTLEVGKPAPHSTREQPTVCRRCVECEGEEHHWDYFGDEDADGEPMESCKHCDATRPISEDDA